MNSLLAHRSKLKDELAAFLEKQKSRDSLRGQWGRDFIKRLKPFVLSGKLLRGSMICGTYAIFSGRPPSPSVIRAAISIELIHAALLIHDDVMDQDSLRRGKPSMNYQYTLKATARNLADVVRFGESMAICAGDAAIFMTLELLNHPENDTTTSSALSALFGQELVRVCMGQMSDIALESSPLNQTKPAIYGVMRDKTASYSFSLPMVAGAILAKQPKKIQDQMHDLSVIAGTIFQIRDDELDMLEKGSEGSDIKRNKKTLLHYYLMKHPDRGKLKRLKSIFGDPKATQMDVGYVHKIILESGVLEKLNREVNLLQTKAFKIINELDITDGARDELRELVVFCATRQT